MEWKELQSKSESELQTLLRTQREQLQTLRFSLAGGKVKNIHSVREAKRTIARILTLLGQRERNGLESQ